ncbi:MAG TPA: class I SAM-dependent methyltransferase [Acidisphaera sp.]|nr:class I SAM-dependent methyltransferase [Acidisphaera sp.]
MSERGSLPAAYFAEKYAADPDPWRFASSDYEARKYAATIAALPRARFASGLEAGCSIGVLTAMLAQRCDALLGFDVVEAALAQARARNADNPQVRIEHRSLPQDWPDGAFDLIVFSEVLYYLDEADLRAVVERVRTALLPGGAVVLVHWLGPTDYPLTGDAATELLTSALEDVCDVTRSERQPDYRLDVLVRRPAAPAQSAARREPPGSAGR